jgi:aspartate ammonia-lyase
LVHAYAELKKACALANIELGLLKPAIGRLILGAIQEILDGKHSGQFPVDAYQAGAGTSTNMNVNEVIANRALELMGKEKGSYDIISPNDHVNMGQSTNDTYPSAVRIAIVIGFEALDSHLRNLEESFKEKGSEFKSLIKSARTHLQDAVPITLGQEFSAYGRTVAAGRTILLRAQKDLLVLGIGGSAAGTGLNTHPRYARLVVKKLNKNLGYGFTNAPDLIESMQSQRQLLGFAAALKAAAVEISRIASDLRLLASGPTTGFNEIVLPAVQPGSSIMPGKVNPSILECVNMVCFRVIGAEAAVTQAVLAGQLSLNVNMPLMASEILEAMKILGNAAGMMAEKCIQGIRANKSQMEKYAYQSAALATVLNPILGYAQVAEIVKESIRTGESLPSIVRRKEILTEAEVKRILDPRRLTRPGIAKKSVSSRS